jgi:hypothetical protein
VRKIRRFTFALFRVKGRTDGQDESNNKYSFLNSSRNKPGSGAPNWGPVSEPHLNTFLVKPRRCTLPQQTLSTTDAVHSDHYVPDSNFCFYCRPIKCPRSVHGARHKLTNLSSSNRRLSGVCGGVNSAAGCRMTSVSWITDRLSDPQAVPNSLMNEALTARKGTSRPCREFPLLVCLAVNSALLRGFIDCRWRLIN